MWNIVEKILEFALKKILRLNINSRQQENLLQFIKFGIVGLSNTIISYVIYVGVLMGLQRINLLPKIDYLIAQFWGFVISVLWSFYWNNKFVFMKNEGEKRNIWGALLKTYISYAFTGLFLNSCLSLIWIEVFKWSKMLAPIINLFVSVPINFVLNKFWAFRKQ